MNFIQKNSLLVLLTILVFCAAVFLIWSQVKRRADQRHYQELERLASQGSGFEAKAEPVEQLGQYNEAHANQLLLQIAQDTDTNPGMRSLAISYLAKHRASTSKEIARLIIPQESLEVRLAATEALMQLGCPSECIRELLHYEERLSYGEHTAEQVIDDRLASQKLPAATKLSQKIRLLFQQNDKSTADVLIQEYGLGGLEPAKFAVYFAQKMPPPSVCALLQQSADDRKNVLGKSSDDLSLLLRTVINKHCTAGNYG